MNRIRVSRVFLLLVLGAAIWSSAAVAAITNTNLGTLGSGTFNIGPITPDPITFEDNYAFQLGPSAPTDVFINGSWETVTGPPPASLVGEIVLVLLQGPGVPVKAATLGPGNTFTLEFAGLQTETEYLLRVFGWSPDGGSITYNASISTVPLPPALLLLGSALLGLTLFGRLHRRNSGHT